MSKATPRGAVAKFAAGGKPAAKKDLGLIAMTYGNIYVASVAMGAKDEHTLKAFLEAEAYDGPSLIIAYSHCIAHGINMTTACRTRRPPCRPVSGFSIATILIARAQGENPLHLDSARAEVADREYLNLENRFRMLTASKPDVAHRLFAEAQARR